MIVKRGEELSALRRALGIALQGRDSYPKLILRPQIYK